ncbi:hypothetical protein C8R43DRAFT_959483 [Mycena crocata]|nr:hypothetical protein C8R43DRAFT_959483 [Mycena crocata]
MREEWGVPWTGRNAKYRIELDGPAVSRLPPDDTGNTNLATSSLTLKVMRQPRRCAEISGEVPGIGVRRQRSSTRVFTRGDGFAMEERIIVDDRFRQGSQIGMDVTREEYQNEWPGCCGLFGDESRTARGYNTLCRNDGNSEEVTLYNRARRCVYLRPSACYGKGEDRTGAETEQMGSDYSGRTIVEGRVMEKLESLGDCRGNQEDSRAHRDGRGGNGQIGAECAQTVEELAGDCELVRWMNHAPVGVQAGVNMNLEGKHIMEKRGVNETRHRPRLIRQLPGNFSVLTGLDAPVIPLVSAVSVGLLKKRWPKHRAAVTRSGVSRTRRRRLKVGQLRSVRRFGERRCKSSSPKLKSGQEAIPLFGAWPDSGRPELDTQRNPWYLQAAAGVQSTTMAREVDLLSNNRPGRTPQEPVILKVWYQELQDVLDYTGWESGSRSQQETWRNPLL